MRFLRPYVRVAALSLLVAVGYALAVPQHASTAIRVEIFVIVALTALALLERSRRRAPDAEASPFDPPRLPRAAPSVPIEVERHAVELRALASGHGPMPLPGALRRTMRAIAAARLRARWGLDLDDPADAAAARARCGPLLWDALAGDPTTADADALVAALEAL
jgi:hypothetical protein